MKYIGIFFSAEWCPPCKGFTSILTEFYQGVNKDEKGNNDIVFEVLFVSCDQKFNEFLGHYGDM